MSTSATRAPFVNPMFIRFQSSQAGVMRADFFDEWMDQDDCMSFAAWCCL